MFLVRDLGIVVFPDEEKAGKKPKDGGFTTCGGFTCLSPTNCGPDPCDCGAKHSCNPGGTCANNTKDCVGRSLPETIETEIDASLDALEYYLAELREKLAARERKPGRKKPGEKKPGPTKRPKKKARP